MNNLPELLEDLYTRYNKREFVHPDPLEFLYQFDNPLDREIAGFIASSLAYGRVNQILKSVHAALEPMGKSPRLFVEKVSLSRLLELYGNFKHRFTTGLELAQVIEGIKIAISKHGTLNAIYVDGLAKGDVQYAMSGLSALLKCQCSLPNVSMIPSPDKESACKRLCLFLRWMVRQDDVDPGGWTGVERSQLLIPLDTHMHSISRKLGLTTRNQANMKTVIELTEAFKIIQSNDPVKYDFCLTRFGIHPEISKTDINF